MHKPRDASVHAAGPVQLCIRTVALSAPFDPTSTAQTALFLPPPPPIQSPSGASGEL